MKKVKFTKLRLVATFSTSFLLGLPTMESEAKAFMLTAPSDALVAFSCSFLARKFSPSPEEKGFIDLALPQAQKRPSPQ